MEVKNFVILPYLLLVTLMSRTVLANTIAAAFFKSLASHENVDRTGNYYVDSHVHDYQEPYDEPLTNYRLSRLRRGYYFVDDGYITAVPASAVLPNSVSETASAARRQDTDGDVSGYRQQRSKHKKLFVPNLYG